MANANRRVQGTLVVAAGSLRVSLRKTLLAAEGRRRSVPKNGVNREYVGTTNL